MQTFAPSRNHGCTERKRQWANYLLVKGVDHLMFKWRLELLAELLYRLPLDLADLHDVFKMLPLPPLVPNRHDQLLELL